jgi:hypothetical protein
MRSTQLGPSRRDSGIGAGGRSRSFPAHLAEAEHLLDRTVAAAEEAGI